MLKPDRAEWAVGQTPWGQPLRLEYEVGSFTLHRDPASQRDDSDRVRGLSAETLRRMADIAEVFENGR